MPILRAVLKKNCQMRLKMIGLFWKRARAVEWAWFEIRYTRKGIGGSNPPASELRREYIERKIGLILLKKLSEGYQCRGSSVVERMPEEHGVASSILARGKKFI